MNQSATITSKMQLTIPMIIARKVGLESGDKVTVSEENGKIVLTPMKQLITELAGSLSMPEKWREKDIDVIVREAKAKHFQYKKI
jgi:AbrB family looped-hinge helix DNA binding protein